MQDFKRNTYQPTTSHPSLIEGVIIGALCMSVWYAVFYIALVQLTGGF